MSIMNAVRRLLGDFDPGAYEPPPGIPAPDQRRDLVLYQYASCPFCLRVMRVLDETGIEVELRNSREPEHRAFMLERTGRTTVPCLFIDDVPLFESRDIAAWLYAYHDQVDA